MSVNNVFTDSPVRIPFTNSIIYISLGVAKWVAGVLFAEAHFRVWALADARLMLEINVEYFFNLRFSDPAMRCIP